MILEKLTSPLQARIDAERLRLHGKTRIQAFASSNWMPGFAERENLVFQRWLNQSCYDENSYETYLDWKAKQ